MTCIAPGRAREVVEAFRGRRTLVVGDAMVDRFVWGEVHRISPEAPVPVVAVERETVRLGGAANVAANLTSLGARATLAAATGADEAAGILRAHLEAGGIEAILVEEASRETTLKTRVLARGQQVVRVDRETERPLGAPARVELVARVLEALSRADVVIVSDYDKGVVGGELLAAVLPRARGAGVPVVADPKLTHFFQYQPVTVVTPNQAEAGRATATEIRSDADCLTATRAILERLDTQSVLVTRGPKGMLLLERGADPEWIPAVAREVFDVTGAGDTVAGVLALSLAAGASLSEAAVFANHAGGVVVGKVGTATVTPAEVLASLGIKV